MSNVSGGQRIVVSSFPGLGLLGAALVILKLMGKVDIPWWGATLPFWIGPAFVGVIALGALVVAGLAAIVAAALDRSGGA